MTAKRKPVNQITEGRRQSARLRGSTERGSIRVAGEPETIAVEELAAETPREKSVEEDTAGDSNEQLREEQEEEEQDAAGRQLMHDVNFAAGKTPERTTSPPRSTRKRPREDEASLAGIPPKPRTPGSTTRIDVIRVEVPSKSPQASQGRLKKAPRRQNSAAEPVQRDIFKLPTTEAGPSNEPRKIRKLNQGKAVNPSPLRKHGVIDLSGTNEVDLDDTRAASRLKKKAKKAKPVPDSLEDDDDESEPEAERNSNSRPTSGTPAPRASTNAKNLTQEPPGNDLTAAGGLLNEARADDGDEEVVDEADAVDEDDREAPKEEERRTREKVERIRRKCKEDAEPHINVFGCGEAWTDLLVAGHTYRKIVREYADDHAHSGSGRKYKARTQVGKAATEALEEVLELCEDGTTHWAAILAAMTTARKTTRLIEDKEAPSPRGVDLYLSVLPYFVRILKAVLLRVKPKSTTTKTQLAPLTGTLEFAWETLERARLWNPRPTALQGYKLLALIRDEYAPSVKQIRKAYGIQLDKMTAAEKAEEAKLKEKRRIEHQNELNKAYKQERERLIQAVRNASAMELRAIHEVDQAKQQWKQEVRAKYEAERKRQEQLQRRPLREITRTIVGTIHDIDDLAEDGTARAIYQDPQEEKWSEAELQALWIALTKEYPKENRFAMIHQRHGSRMPGRSVDEIRRQAVVLKRGCEDLVRSKPPEEAATWNFLMSVPG